MVRLWCSQLRCILPPAENPEGPGQIFAQLQRCHLLLWRLVRSSQGSLLTVFLQVSQINWPVSASRECHNACLFLGQKKGKITWFFCPQSNAVEQINALIAKLRSSKL